MSLRHNATFKCTVQFAQRTTSLNSLHSGHTVLPDNYILRLLGLRRNALPSERRGRVPVTNASYWMILIYRT